MTRTDAQLTRETEDANRSERLRYHLHMLECERYALGGVVVLVAVAALLFLIVWAVAS